MDLATLRIFKAVVEEGGVGRAARKLHRVQSNVTTRIQQLEASLGTKLFVRERRRLHLSPAGETLLEYTDRLLSLSEQARAAVQGGEPRGILRLGTLESTAASRLPRLLARFHGEHPAVRIELSTGTNDALLDELLARHIDAAFVVEVPAAARLDSVPAFDEELVIVAPRRHPPIRRAADIRAPTLIAFPSGCAYRRRLQAWLAQGGIVPERTLELASYHAIIACVASGAGVALMPRSVLDTLRATEEVAAHRLPKGSGRLTTRLAWRKAESSAALRALSAALAGKK